MNIFMANPTVTVGLISFISAQIIKTALFAIKQKTFNPERITGAGGMPSSHSALVVSVALYLLRLEGFSSSTFALSIIIMGIVIYDALSVRYNAGLHGKELNRLRKVIDEMDDEISRLSGEERASGNTYCNAVPAAGVNLRGDHDTRRFNKSRKDIKHDPARAERIMP